MKNLPHWANQTNSAILAGGKLEKLSAVQIEFETQVALKIAKLH